MPAPLPAKVLSAARPRQRQRLRRIPGAAAASVRTLSHPNRPNFSTTKGAKSGSASSRSRTARSAEEQDRGVLSRTAKRGHASLLL